MMDRRGTDQTGLVQYCSARHLRFVRQSRVAVGSGLNVIRPNQCGVARHWVTTVRLATAQREGP